MCVLETNPGAEGAKIAIFAAKSGEMAMKKEAEASFFIA